MMVSSVACTFKPGFNKIDSDGMSVIQLVSLWTELGYPKRRVQRVKLPVIR